MNLQGIWVTEELVDSFHKSFYSMAGNAFNTSVASIMIISALAILGRLQEESASKRQPGDDQTHDVSSSSSEIDFLAGC